MMTKRREHEREMSEFVASVRMKLRAVGRDDAVVTAAKSKDLDAAQKDTEWNLITGTVVDGSHLVCKHKGDPTQGDFGTSFVVFGKCGGRWDKSAMVIGPEATRPYNWGGRTTKSLEQALGAICGVTAKKRMRGKRS